MCKYFPNSLLILFCFQYGIYSIIKVTMCYKNDLGLKYWPLRLYDSTCMKTFEGPDPPFGNHYNTKFHLGRCQDKQLLSHERSLPQTVKKSGEWKCPSVRESLCDRINVTCVWSFEAPIASDALQEKNIHKNWQLSFCFWLVILTSINLLSYRTYVI